MNRREFHFADNSSNKFWAIELEGSGFTVHFGRVGTSGQAQVKSFPTEDAARREYEKLIGEKTRKGYLEVSTALTTGSATPPVARQAATPVTAPATIASPVTTPAAPLPEASPNRPDMPPPGTELLRSIQLEPADAFVVTWQNHDTLPRPVPPAFTMEDGLKRLVSIGTSEYGYQNDWRKARIPAFPSRQEAHFWLLAAYEGIQQTPQKVATALAQVVFDGKLSPGDAINYADRASDFREGCLAALLQPDDYLTAESCYVDLCFTRYTLPFLDNAQKEGLRRRLRGSVKLLPPSDWPVSYWVAAALGLHDEIAALLKSLPDSERLGKHYCSDSYKACQWLVFGLGDSQTVEAEFRRLGLYLRHERQVRAWLALTGFRALDVVSDSVCGAMLKEDAAALGKCLLLVAAPEAALPAVRIILNSRAPQAGHQWLAEHPLHAAIGLTPIAMGGGKQGDVAREHLSAILRGGQREVLGAAMRHLAPEEQAWLQLEILDNAEDALPEAAEEDLPEALRTALHEKKSIKALAWPPHGSMPAIKVGGKRLAQPDAATVLAVLKATEPGAVDPLLSALKQHADPRSLDRLAWKLFDLWMSNGSPSKEKWALGAIGHLGGDGCVLKLSPLVRAWPGESQHQRAVLGLEVLRAVGTDTALMALNGIAQKLKFKALQEKAQRLMEEIAQARGFTREQLGDRIVPDCGLDERGTRVFDFGPRQFRFVLGPELKPLIRDSAGKLRPDLPAPNSADDPAKSEAAVTEWKLLKKTLKEVLKLQVDRLEDAMITGRRWTPDEFDQLMIKQPLMTNLARLILFGSYDASGTLTATFRVTEDQSLADSSDQEMALPRSGPIGVVHPVQLDEATRAAWGEILSDYEILPPFPQLGRPIFRPAPEDLDKTEITRFRGKEIPGIAVYGILERSLWTRNTSKDGGAFWQHSKYFGAADVTAFIHYTGMAMNFYEEPQEIESVFFLPGHAKPDTSTRGGNGLKVGTVDTAVVGETYRLVDALLAKVSAPQ